MTEEAVALQQAHWASPLLDKVMVCMSSNALAPRVIRTGAAVAHRLGTCWYAVYVETPRERPSRLSSDRAEALQQNIAIAEELGATVVRVRADEPGQGLIAFARREGVTRVVFGQTGRSRLERLWRGSPLQTFSSAIPHARVEVVPLEPTMR